MSIMLKKRIAVLALCLGSSAAGAAPSTTPRIVAAANVFLATLGDAEKSAVLFEPGDSAQKQRWSNLPGSVFKARASCGVISTRRSTRRGSR